MPPKKHQRTIGSKASKRKKTPTPIGKECMEEIKEGDKRREQLQKKRLEAAAATETLPEAPLIHSPARSTRSKKRGSFDPARHGTPRGWQTKTHPGEVKGQGPSCCCCCCCSPEIVFPTERFRQGLIVCWFHAVSG